MRIAIGTPTYGTMPGSCLHSYALLCANSAKEGYLDAILHVNNTYLDAARNHIVQMARDINCTHIFWMDSDMVVPSDAIKNLVALEVPIIGGFTTTRVTPATCTAFNLPYEPITTWIGDGLTTVDGLGMAATLVDMAVYDKVEAEFGDTMFYHVMSQPNGGVMGEDVWFAIRCKEIGISMVLDARIKCGHVGEMVYGAS